MSLIPPTETFGNREPPPREENEQYLFLLEFFVHRVSGERLAKLNSMFFVPTRVRAKFLHFDDEDIAVTPVDLMFEPQAGTADYAETFNSGRSVMFAIDRASVTDKAIDFTLSLTVEKKMPEDMRPDVVVGRGEIDMSKHFAALRKEMLQCLHTNYPPPKIYEGQVDLFNDESLTGSLAIYVRISGFGQSIVTEIETPKPNDKASSYVFKSSEKDEKQLAYDCRPISSSKMDICKDTGVRGKDEDNCQVCQPSRYDCSPCGLSRGAGKRPSPMANDDRAGGEPDRGLKTILDGRALTRPWNPMDSSHPEETNRAERQIREFHEQAQSQGLPIQSSRGPTEPCGRAVVLKVSGLLDVEDPDGRRKHPTVTVASKSMEHNVDPEHDVFILRIGKKGIVGAGEKSDIQLEMRTPKGPERRPPIRYETREMQTEDADEERRDTEDRRATKERRLTRKMSKKKKKKKTKTKTKKKSPSPKKARKTKR